MCLLGVNRHCMYIQMTAVNIRYLKATTALKCLYPYIGNPYWYSFFTNHRHLVCVESSPINQLCILCNLSQEEELDKKINNLASQVGTVYKWLAPKAYSNQVGKHPNFSQHRTLTHRSSSRFPHKKVLESAAWGMDRMMKRDHFLGWLAVWIFVHTATTTSTTWPMEGPQWWVCEC